MKKNLFNILGTGAIVVGALLMAACTGEQFHVIGEIANAKDSVLYFEHNSLDGFQTIDSVKLDEKGNFSFDGDRADNPEFYRLRIAGQIIHVAIDSTETVNIKGKYPTMATEYTIDGYENEKIKELTLKQIQLQNQCQLLSQQAISADSIQMGIMKMVQAYKDDVERNYIFKEPMKAYAYFALFQYIVIGNQPSMIFDPSRDPNDVKVFGAVATSWDTYYPNSERGKNLHNIAIQGMKNDRIVRNNRIRAQIDASKMETAGVIQVALQDKNGQTRRLTDLKGRVVMLDFHVYGAGEESTKRIMMLRELYNKYHAQGLEIYQVGLDANQHFWLQQTQNLPWICVWDPQGLESENLAHYNVQTVPTFFLIDKNNVLQKRDVQITDLYKDIQSML